MTLPKNITDAIDTHEAMVREDGSGGSEEETRAALEAAILAAIQPAPVEPPTDAEVEAWERKARLELVVGMDDRPIRPRAFHVTETEIEAAVALMRRARATGSLERLRDRVESEAQRVAELQNLERNIGIAKALGWVLGWIDEERGAGR